jgi:hypothetical protein
MKRLGVENVRRRLDYGRADPEPEAQVRNIVNEPPYPTRAFVEGLDKKDKHRAWIVFWTLIFAAVAAIPAAPIIWGIVGPWVQHAIVWLRSVALTLMQ